MRCDVDLDASRSAIARKVGSAERREARTEIDDQRRRTIAGADRLNEVRDSRGRQRRVERIRFESNHQPGALLSDRVRRGGSHVQRESDQRSERLEPSGDLRHPEVAGDDQPRRLPEIDTRTQCGCERARDEIDGDEPHATFAHRSGRERDQPAPDRGERLARAEHDRLRLRCHRESAGCDILAKREIEHACQVVEGEHLLTADRPYGERPTAVAGHDGVGSGALRRRLSLLCLRAHITRKMARRQSREGDQ